VKLRNQRRIYVLVMGVAVLFLLALACLNLAAERYFPSVTALIVALAIASIIWLTISAGNKGSRD
jgi:hypothetical protein